MDFAVVLAGLINSIGTLAIWVMLNPYFANLTNDLALTGNLASIRQFSFLIGTIFATAWADVGRPLSNLIAVQIIELLLGLTLLLGNFFYGDSLGASWIMVWCMARFLNGGLTFIFGFRVHARGSSTAGLGSIVHLFITNGANAVGPLLSILLLKFSKNPIGGALIVDVVSSIVYLLTLVRLRGTRYDPHLSGEVISPFASAKRNLLLYWDQRALPWSRVQIIFLLASTGFLLSNQVISRQQTVMHSDQFYSAAMLIYGLSLWLTSFIRLYFRNIRVQLILFIGTCLLGCSGAFIFLLNGYWAFLSIFFHSMAFWLVVNETNQLIIDSVGEEKAGRMRAAMLFYMSIILGIGETAFGKLAAYNVNLQVSLVTRTIGCFFVLLLIRKAFKETKETWARS